MNGDLYKRQGTDGYLYQIKQDGIYFGRIILALKNHGCENAGDRCEYYSLETYYSNDNGITWNEGGIIEDYYYTQDDVTDPKVAGLWEPFLMEIKDPDRKQYKEGLYVYYAREYLVDDNNILQQEIVQRQSFDGGIHWTFDTIVSRSGTRDGMPAVTQISDGTLICAFETSRIGHDGLIQEMWYLIQRIQIEEESDIQRKL